MNPFWLDELNRMNRLLRELKESSVLEAIRETEQHRQLLGPPGYRALRELEDVIGAGRAFENLAAGFSSVVGQYDVLKVFEAARLPDVVAPDLQRAFEVFQTPALPALQSWANHLRSVSRDSDAIRQFQDTFAGQLLEKARDLAKAPEGECEQRAEDLAELLGTHLAKSSGGPVSAEGYVQIILPLVLFILSVIGAQQSEERIVEHLSNIRAQLQAISAVEQERVGTDLRLVAAASLRIRSEPSGKSEIVGKLTRSSLVLVISREKSWARVEYFDFVEGRTKEGWVAHRFLQELPEEFWQGGPARQTDAEVQAARERFERHFGEVDLGYPTGVDNEQIDADLAIEYAGADQPN